jgi:hypothetical protein
MPKTGSGSVEYRGDKIGVFDTKTETFTEWSMPTIRLLQDFGGRNGYPRAIDLHLVVAIDLSP